jgi:hypothetical protein
LKPKFWVLALKDDRSFDRRAIARLRARPYGGCAGWLEGCTSYMSSCQYTILSRGRAFDQEADSPEEAIKLFIQRIKEKGNQSRTKISKDREISLSLYDALVSNSLKLVVVSKSERPRKVLGGFDVDQYVSPVSRELAESVHRLLTEEEFRTALAVIDH